MTVERGGAGELTVALLQDASITGGATLADATSLPEFNHGCVLGGGQCQRGMVKPVSRRTKPPLSRPGATSERF